MKKRIVCLLVLLMTLSLAACGNRQNPSSTPANPVPTTSSRPETSVAHVEFQVVVKDLDGNAQTFTYRSSAKTVGEALLVNGLIDGYQGDYGLVVEAVNGITADWDTENAYWAFYINGEYAQTGVDSTELTDGAVYTFEKTVSYTEKGTGATSFYFTVKDLDGTVTKFIIHTNETTVGQALLELGLLAGEYGDYGLMVTTVNGITADWETEQAYWAFYVNGEYAQTGVDSTEIVADAQYEMAKTPG